MGTDHKTLIPWPGPCPYDEGDWENFYGRDAQVRELLQRVRCEKLTILLGASGTGKTSLLRAGVVPMLRHERYHPEGSQSAWPVLLLRRWGGVASTSLEENLLLQLESAIAAIESWGKSLGQWKAEADAEELRTDLRAFLLGNSDNVNIFGILEELALKQFSRANGDTSDRIEQGKSRGLILMFDQFEEQLRAGPHAVSEALSLISNLVQSGAPLRVLVSLRQEYRYALRRLELTVGGLGSRSIYLEPLREPVVSEIITLCSEASSVPIEKEVALRMVSWLATSPQSDPEKLDEEQRPDLLHLQAVLLELCHFVLVAKQRRVDMAVLDKFMSHMSRNRENSDKFMVERSVVRGALERWIESALLDGSDDNNDGIRIPKSRSYAAWARMSPENLRLQVHRIGIRLAPLLSSGDYKVAQEENALFRATLGEEVARLGIKAPEFRSRIRLIEGGETNSPRLNWDELGLAENLPEHNLSGLARVEHWSPEETGDQIVVCFKETLHRLERANILQYTFFGARKELYWELVHDQLGSAFLKWAERLKYTWDDCRSSLVACNGVQPIAVPVAEIGLSVGTDYYDLNMISWQGCRVENSRSERLTLRNVRFRACYLGGTIFDSIDFVGCAFEDCDLTGGLFRNCRFQPNEEGRPTVFVRCDSNITIVASSIELLEFRDCHLHQPSISRCRLAGEIRYTEGSRVIQAFYDIGKSDVARDVRILFDETSRACFCTATRECFGYLDFEAEVPGMHNTPVRADFRTRPVQGE